MASIDLYQVSLKVILKNAQSEVLILKSVDWGDYGGYWDFPGGRIDEDEFAVPFAEIIKRELAEEVGELQFTVHDVPAALGRHQGKTRDGNRKRVLYLFFEAEYMAGDVLISEEHTEYQWVDLHKMKIEDYFISGLLEGVRMYLKK